MCVGGEEGGRGRVCVSSGGGGRCGDASSVYLIRQGSSASPPAGGAATGPRGQAAPQDGHGPWDRVVDPWLRWRSRVERRVGEFRVCRTGSEGAGVRRDVGRHHSVKVCSVLQPLTET